MRHPTRRRPRIFFEPGVDSFKDCIWRPAVDVRRAPYGWLIKAEVAGVALQDVTIELQGNSVVLSGVRRDTLLAEGDSYYALEISYCRFERRIDLPTPVDQAELRVSASDGLLILRLTVERSNPDSRTSA